MVREGGNPNFHSPKKGEPVHACAGKGAIDEKRSTLPSCTEGVLLTTMCPREANSTRGKKNKGGRKRRKEGHGEGSWPVVLTPWGPSLQGGGGSSKRKGRRTPDI